MRPKTVEIPRELIQAVDEGLIPEEDLKALEEARDEAKEKIERFRRLYREHVISHSQLEQGIKNIREDMQRKILALDFII